MSNLKNRSTFILLAILSDEEIKINILRNEMLCTQCFKINLIRSLYSTIGGNEKNMFTSQLINLI